MLQHTTFHTTVGQLHQLPPPDGVEVAFAGRSNAGKSSAINSLTRRTRLAFVSKTPGRTQHINFFKLGPASFLVDLPGYGYAKVPLGVRHKWEHLLGTYLQTRESLHGMVLVMDVRHPLTSLDLRMLGWFGPTGKPVHVLLAKSDKLSRRQAVRTLAQVSSYLREAYPQCSTQLFSSLTKEGVKEAMAVLEEWFGEEGSQASSRESPDSGEAGKTGIKSPRLKGIKTGGKLP
ncbi:ribosome biogenesis GTP-binding protein YihA/YsxC [Nitrosovibrio sp. Nv17]|uniref:ribosome biogenesis GTP-binding protein YihA/YsxC n=1 Tax=Nitrosovibrio sp. Nv17 TaxID=1855339 RepID=UPI000908530A|nr:ribosome biogenesis GTP-binding protein YihA/YsxC [Nitrosovibrio sp. Nv17]SFW36440.1 cell division checkpoint GTPase YihA [Nitrosovibrio sp. Nv17]